MANELLYVPGVGTRYYYNPTTAGTVTLTKIGSGTLTSALENGRPVMTFGGKALKFSIGNGMQNSRTIEYWMTLSGWNNVGTSHQWGHFGSRSVGFVKWLPKPVAGTNNVNFQLNFSDGDPEDTVVTLADQTTPIHVAQVFDTSDSSYQLKLYINGVKVKECYYHNPWTNVILIGGSIAQTEDTTLTDVFTGKISDFLVTDGAKYTANFTPARPKVNLKNLAKGGNPLENFTAPEIEYLDVESVPYKLPSGGSVNAEWGNIGGTLSEQTDLKNALDGKANTALSNLTDEGTNIGNWSSNVSNCITKIPQDIRLELTDGTLTLKAGSKVYVPNGAGVFNVVTIANDITYGGSSTSWSNTKWLVCTSNGELFVNNGDYTSGSTYTGGTYGIWYDTTNNIVKYTNNGGSTWTSGYSLPLAQITVVRGTGVTSIDKVFNGFGYIGNTIFVLPGVEGLVPNGRNTDGSLKNTKFTLNTVKPITLQDTYTADAVIFLSNSTLSVLRETFYSYDEKNNFNLQEGTPTTWMTAGKFSCTSGRITSFSPKTAFHALDFNDKSLIAGWAMPSDSYKSLTLGASASSYTAPADGWFCLNGKDSGNTGTFEYVMRNQTRYFGIAGSNLNTSRTPSWSAGILPVKTGDVVQLYCSGTLAFNSTNFELRFYYAEGSKSEAN